jgi:hypothetical protein
VSSVTAERGKRRKRGKARGIEVPQREVRERGIEPINSEEQPQPPQLHDQPCLTRRCRIQMSRHSPSRQRSIR